jgi:hypothetical protein
MILRAIFVFYLLGAFTGLAFAQNGGKAEPQRIRFAAGRSETTLSGKLSNGQEMEFIFGARKGQTVTIRNARSALFDFRVYSEEADFETEFESSPTLTFEIPETGDYKFFVRKKMVSSPRTARFSINLSIK